jgi:arginine N-succinyltransferase
MDEGGHSPFWDAIGGRFFGMTFPEADEFNAIHGTQFIADLFPKSPIYVSMLPESARAVIGQPHPTGKAALKMLEHEGFVWDCYVDIFDGGPTVTARTDHIRTIREAQSLRVLNVEPVEGRPMLVTHGRLQDFVACYAMVESDGSDAAIDSASRKLLGVEAGDRVLAVAR